MSDQAASGPRKMAATRVESSWMCNRVPLARIAALL